MLIIADAGPILSFARAGYFDLLRDVVGTLTVPETVYEEIVVQGAGKPGAEDVQQAAWIKRERVTVGKLGSESYDFHEGSTQNACWNSYLSVGSSIDPVVTL